MSRHQKDPLRPLTPEERTELTRLSRSQSAPAAEVDRACALLAIADLLRQARVERGITLQERTIIVLESRRARPSRRTKSP